MARKKSSFSTNHLVHSANIDALSKTVLDKIMEVSLDIICAISVDGIVLNISAASKTILGYTPDELVGKQLYELIYHEDVAYTQMMAEKMMAGNDVANFENRYVRKDGSLVYLQWSARYDPINHIRYGIARDISELKQREASIIESEKKYKHLFENNPLPVILWDFETGKIVDCNEEAMFKYGYTKPEFTQLSIIDIRPEEDRPLFEQATKTEKSFKEISNSSWRHQKKNGEIMFMDICGHIIEVNGRKVVIAIGSDVTERRYYTELDQLEKNILETNVKREKTLDEMIKSYLSGIEALHPGMLTSMQEKRGQQLFSMCSPNVPTEYLKEIDGAEIGPNAGSCGTAAFLREKVIVSDIAHDVRWSDYRESAARYSLKSCWSYPLLNGNGEVMATFACYYQTPKMPTAYEENTVQRAVHILQVILESYQRRIDLQESNERFEYATEATSDVVWDWNLETNAVYYSKNIYNLFGHKLGTNNNNMPFYLKNIHPEDKEHLLLDPEKIKYGDMVQWVQEYRFRKGDGEYAFVLDKGVVIRDKNGIGSRMVGAMQDITKQKIEDLQLALIAEISQIFNENVELNDALYKILDRLVEFGKCSIAEAWLIGTDKSKIVLASKFPKNPEMKVFYDESDQIQSFTKGEGLPGIVWETGVIQYWQDLQHHESFVRRDAAQKVGLKAAYGIPLKYNNEVIGVFLIGLNRAEKIEVPFTSFFEKYSSHFGAEIQRKQLEGELNQIFNYAADIICVAGFDGFYKKMNPAMCSLLEYTEAELMAKPFMEFVHPDDRDISMEEVGEVNQGKTTYYFENRHITKSGKIKWLAWTATPSPEDGLFFGVAKDVTDKKELEDLLSKASSLAHIGSWEIDLVKDTIYWSDMTKTIHEVEDDFVPDAVSAINFFKSVTDKEVMTQNITSAIEDGTHFDTEVQIVTAKGQEKWVRIIGEPEFIQDECIRVYGSLQDIDARKKAAISLKASEKRYSELFHLSPLPMWVIDYETFLFLDINQAAIEHYGYTSQEFLSMTLKDIVVEEEVPNLENVVWRDKEGNMDNYIGTFSHKKKNGDIIQVDIQSNIIQYGGKKAKVTLVNDITERLKYIKAIEEQNKRLTEISWLQSHVIRAPLARIMGLIQLMNDTEPVDEEKTKILDFVLISAKELDDVISNISDKTKIVDF